MNPALIEILTQPKNALVKQYGRLFEMEGVKLTFTPASLDAVAKKAIERKTGARGLRSILENILLDTMFELPDVENRRGSRRQRGNDQRRQASGLCLRRQEESQKGQGQGRKGS